MPTVERMQTLPNGAIVVDVKMIPLYPSQPLECFVLALQRKSGGYEYITWHCDHMGYCDSGHYHSDLSSAVADFQKRG